MKLIINDKEFKFFSDYEINLNFNSIASSFNVRGLRNFLPSLSSYANAEVFDNDNNLLITGTIIRSDYPQSRKPELVSVSGYSLPGVLEDANINNYPLQTDNLRLKEIIDRLLSPFSLSYIAATSITKDFNTKIDKSAASATQTVKSYINQLCSQRNILLSHNEKGNLIFTRIDLNKLNPIPMENIISAGLSINGQALFNPIKVIRQASRNNPDAGEAVINNVYCPVYRPKTKLINSGNIFDVEKAAINELAAQLSTIKLTINTRKDIKPNNLISVRLPELGINELTEFFVESTSIKGTKTGEIYTLTCVLKDVYSGKVPVFNIFDTLNFDERKV